MKHSIIKGDIFKYAREGAFNLLVHGCNTQSLMKSGIAVDMVKLFSCNTFDLELQGEDINKLGMIDYEEFWVSPQEIISYDSQPDYPSHHLIVINAYTQAFPRIPLTGNIPLDYEALTLCFRKINYAFPQYTLGIPYMIGCGKAKGNIDTVKNIILKECSDLKEILFYDNNTSK